MKQLILLFAFDFSPIIFLLIGILLTTIFCSNSDLNESITNRDIRPANGKNRINSRQMIEMMLRDRELMSMQEEIWNNSINKI
jgi:hypothetical protein